MAVEFQGSKDLFQKAEKLIPGGVNSPVRAFRKVTQTPIYFEKASGSHFQDVDNNEFVDFCQSWGPLILGHARPEVVEAVQKAAVDGLSYGACHRKEIALAEIILEAMPEFDQVRAVNSGTEAVMTALRIARGYTKRNLILKFNGGYHGHFDGMLVKAGSGLATHAISDSAGVPDSIAETTLVSNLNDENNLLRLFEAHGKDIAAVIIEPLPANNGLLVQQKGFLELLRGLTEQYKSLLIFDEVISGFRLHFGGYYQKLGITPDLVTLGKIIGGGMPVGAVVGPQKIMDTLAPNGSVYQAGTLSGNPVSLAAGIATLQILRDESPYEHLDVLAEAFLAKLSESQLPLAKAQRVGSILWLYLDDGPLPLAADDISSEAMERFDALYTHLLQKGYYLPPSSYEVLFLSAAHTVEEVEGLANEIISFLKG